ncbi:hypothetical protein A2U01_0019601, partial [Trifolium medium]|nr:hypothetical protein [Trifolium medium]
MEKVSKTLFLLVLIMMASFPFNSVSASSHSNDAPESHGLENFTTNSSQSPSQSHSSSKPQQLHSSPNSPTSVTVAIAL